MALKDFFEDIPEIHLPPEVVAELAAIESQHGRDYVVTWGNHPELMRKAMTAIAAAIDV